MIINAKDIRNDFLLSRKINFERGINNILDGPPKNNEIGLASNWDCGGGRELSTCGWEDCLE